MRCIHIEGKASEKGGSFVSILDADTGEQISDIASVTIMLTKSSGMIAGVMHSDGAIQWCDVKKIDVTTSSEVRTNLR